MSDIFKKYNPQVTVQHSENDKNVEQKVNYIDMGHEGTTYIELSVDENWNVIMTGLRPDASYK